MNPTAENVRLREKYLSRRLTDSLLGHVADSATRSVDAFTAMPTDDLPKAFRVGECKVVDPGIEVQFDILLFWKDNTRTEQKHVSAFVKKENNKWLIDSVSPLGNK